MKPPESTKPPAAMSTGSPDVPASTATPPHDALSPGTTLERFEVESVLAASGFGIVYLALDRRTGSRNAIKEYLPVSLALRADDGMQVLLREPDHETAFERGRRAFLEEAQLLARCDHPALLHVLHTWEAHGTAYRAMPYYPGTNLLTLRQTGDSPPDEASLRALLRELLGALEVLHGGGRIHGEVSPGNILLLPDDRPVLLDFDDVRHAIVGEQTQALMALVEPTFAPVEQFGMAPGREVGPWTDLYSLAATVHYCISGRLPAAPSGWTPEALEPLDDVMRRLSQHNPSVHYTPSFLAAIESALAVQPQDRPQDVAEFRAALQADSPRESGPSVDYTAERSAGAPAEDEAWVSSPSWQKEVPSRASTPRPQPRHAAAWMLGAVALIALGAGGWMLGQRQLEQADQSAAVARGATQDAPAPQSAITLPVPPPVAPPPTVADAPAPPPGAMPTAVTGSSQVELPDEPTGAVAAAPATPAPRAPAAARPRSTPRQVAEDRPVKAATAPRELCGTRTRFALYRCMKALCLQTKWTQHRQCKRLRELDAIDERKARQGS